MMDVPAKPKPKRLPRRPRLLEGDADVRAAAYHAEVERLRKLYVAEARLASSAATDSAALSLAHVEVELQVMRERQACGELPGEDLRGLANLVRQAAALRCELGLSGTAETLRDDEDEED